MSNDDNSYGRRTWTLQECVLNPRTTVIHLDGNVTLLGDPSSRSRLSGLPPDDPILREGLDDIQSYAWVLAGYERQAAAVISHRSCRRFSQLASSRAAIVSADKAVALGQIFFRVMFPSPQ
eukprot:scaffold1552_cov42-Prasinocladus_malaysianus.AAC.1